MKLRAFAIGSFAALAVACGSPGGSTDTTPQPTPSNEPVPGAIEVDYQFQGVEQPTRVDVLLIDANATGQTCATVPYTPTQNIAGQQNNLPPTAVTRFETLDDGDRWLVYVIGYRNNNIRVADACHDNISVRADQTTTVAIDLLNRPLDVAGEYDTTLALNLELPDDVVDTLLLLDFACNSLGLDPEICDITSGVLDILTSMDVDATWVLTQNGEVVSGEMVWNTVEGQDVGQWDLVSGGFTAEIPGATGLQFKAHTLEIKFDQLVLFLLEDVMEVNLGQLGPVVGIVADYLADELVSDITILDATGTAADPNTDGLADLLDGEMDAQVTFPAFDYTHDFTFDWDAERI